MTRRQATAAEVLARAEANGYKRGAHKEQDRVEDERRHNGTTKKNQNGTLKRYVLWQLAYTERDYTERGIPVPSEEDVRTKYLSSGAMLPDLATVKDFLRFYIHTSQPRLTDRTTTDSMGTVSEWFFAGFTRLTGTVVSAEVRSEVYGWLRKVLTAEGLLVNRRKGKHNFTEKDMERILVTLWTKDDLMFIPERYRIQFTFIVRVYCWTGARLGAFFTGGLRYRDIELVLKRTADDKWTCFYKLDQRWVKNNRDPENIVFGTVLREHDTLLWDDTVFLLIMAFADKAIWGFDTMADLQEQRIPQGQDYLTLRWRDSVLNKPILRKCTQAGGVMDEPMPKSAFTQIFQSTLLNAEYNCAATVHSIRRQLGKKVDELYTEVQRSQHLTQADPRIFGQAYVANTSSVDGQGAFLGEAVQHEHIEYFQGLERFREPGLPCELPARLEDELEWDPKVQELEREVQECPRECPTALEQSKQLLASYRKRLKRVRLHEYQDEWIRERRDWQIITRGKGQRDDPRRNDLVQSLFLLFPERRRIAEQLVSKEAMTTEGRWLVMEDLYKLCTRDLTVLFLPGHQPVGGRCPVKCCRLELELRPKGDRNQHIQACVRREIASQRGYLQSDVHYCYWCYSWVVGRREWTEHCQMHIDTLDTKRCGTITYCYSLVRPGYCPFRLGDSTLSPDQRLQSWCRDTTLWQQMAKYLQDSRWPQCCPYPLFDVSLKDGQDLRYHFIDVHGLSRKLPKEVKHLFAPSSAEQIPACSRKRKNADNGGGGVKLSWVTHEHLLPTVKPRKKVQRDLPTIVPSLLSCAEVKVEDPPSVIDLTASDSTPNSPKELPYRHSSTDVEDNNVELSWKVDPQSPLHYDAAHQTSVPLMGIAPPWDGEFVYGTHSSLGMLSPETSLHDSTDSTLVDSPQWDDDLLAQFIRSPSPESGNAQREEIGENETQQNGGTPDSDAPPSSDNAIESLRGGQRTGPSPKVLNKVSIRLRVQPKPVPNLPKSKIILRFPARKRPQRAQRRRQRSNQ